MSCAAPESAPAEEDSLLTPLWTLDGLAQPESIIPRGDGTYIVSLVNGEGSEKDGNGTLALISADGELLQSDWVSQLDAPKGLARTDTRLFVSDIDQLVEIDLATGEIVQRVTVADAGFLNDVLVFGDTVLVSDSRKARIVSVRDSGASVWLEDARLEGVNGLFDDGERLIVSTMTEGALLAVNPDTKAMTQLGEAMENADGIVRLDNGTFLVSSWPGTIYQLSGDGTPSSVVMDTTGTPILQNDMVRDGDLLLIPNWVPGSVSAYRLNMN